MGFKPVFLWTDLALWALVIALVAYLLRWPVPVRPVSVLFRRGEWAQYAIIRPARPEDAAALGVLGRQTFLDTFVDGFAIPYPADDLAALLKYLGVEKAVLVGMSQGGYLSLRSTPGYDERIKELTDARVQQQGGL